MNRQHPELFRRHKLNPILTAADWPYPVHTVFNPAATLLPNDMTLLLCRVEDRRGLSHLCVARSANGVDGWQIDPQPSFRPDPDHFPEELWGIEDPRITFIPELGRYAIVYTAFTRDGPGVALAHGDAVEGHARPAHRPDLAPFVPQGLEERLVDGHGLAARLGDIDGRRLGGRGGADLLGIGPRAFQEDLRGHSAGEREEH